MQSKWNKVGLCAGALMCAAGSALAGGPFPPGPGNWGPDVTLCQVYGLANFGRLGDTVGLALATTSWNVGTAQLLWEQSSDPDHPFIIMNMYQLKNDRFKQIGQSWIKHGFFALSNQQCGVHPYTGGGCQGTNGTRLGIGCTDTYGASLNASQSGLGPRFEVNPWTGGWNFAGSMFQVGGPSNTAIRRRLQVKDADLGQNVNGNNTSTYYGEAYYVAKDDVDVMNNAGWKQVTITGNSGASYGISMSGSTTDEVSGFAIDAWPGARKTMIAQSLPIVEQWSATNAPRPGFPAPGPVSPDGRAIVGSKVIDESGNGAGPWRYEFFILNIDMDRQISTFTVDVPSDVTVTNIGFSSVLHHDEPRGYVGGPPVDNDPWTSARNSTNVTWSTDAHNAAVASNPIRWGTGYNFWFTADQPPVDGNVTLGMYKPGTPSSLTGVSNVPQAAPPPPCCFGDADGSDDVGFSDATAILANFGVTGKIGILGDASCDGNVDFTDITAMLSVFGQRCPTTN